MRVNIEFGGFYGSVHEMWVEQAVEAIYADDYETDEELGRAENDPNWNKCYENYMREWLDIFSMWLSDEYGVQAKFTKPTLKSPKYYNYATDTIDCNLTKREVTDIVDLVKGQMEFMRFLADATQNTSGFISFYTFKEALADKDGVLIQYALRYLAEQFNNTELDSYWDKFNCYERIV